MLKVKRLRAWLWSFIRQKPVLISQSFTTDDVTVEQKALNRVLNRPIHTKPGVVKYETWSGMQVFLIGTYIDRGHTVYRVKDLSDGKEYQMSELLFKLLFKLI